MFEDDDLRLLLATCSTFGVTRTGDQPELSYSYADLKDAHEKINAKKELPSAVVLFRMLKDYGFRRVTIGNRVCMAAPWLTVASVAYEKAKEVLADLQAKRRK